MPKATNFAFSSPQKTVTRGRPRKYPADLGNVRVTDLCKSVLRAFRRFLKNTRVFAMTENKLFLTFQDEFVGVREDRKRIIYSQSYINEMFKHKSFKTKFKKWVDGDDKTLLRLNRKALLHAKFLAETR